MKSDDEKPQLLEANRFSSGSVVTGCDSGDFTHSFYTCAHCIRDGMPESVNFESLFVPATADKIQRNNQMTSDLLEMLNEALPTFVIEDKIRASVQPRVQLNLVQSALQQRRARMRTVPSIANRD